MTEDGRFPDEDETLYRTNFENNCQKTGINIFDLIAESESAMLNQDKTK